MLKAADVTAAREAELKPTLGSGKLFRVKGTITRKFKLNSFAGAKT